VHLKAQLPEVAKQREMIETGSHPKVGIAR
jgi:hypothetical protein